MLTMKDIDEGATMRRVFGVGHVFLTLDPDNGAVTVAGKSRYYEGTTCGATNLRRSGEVAFLSAILQGRSASYTAALSDDEGSVDFNVQFTSVEARANLPLSRRHGSQGEPDGTVHRG